MPTCASCGANARSPVCATCRGKASKSLDSQAKQPNAKKGQCFICHREFNLDTLRAYGGICANCQGGKKKKTGGAEEPASKPTEKAPEKMSD